MELKYDFHIHTGLSACAVDEMTPNNIVNMALLMELDAIAITDHNTCENVKAIMEVAKETDLLVVPGIEVSTSEEIHVVCLLPTLDQVMALNELVYSRLPKFKSNDKIFGKQLLMDKEDNVIGNLQQLLSFATELSIDDLINVVDNLGGIAIPAHIDRPSNSIISNLGMVPEYLNIPTIELSRYVSINDFKEQYKGYRLIQSSDAHELGYIGICKQTIEVREKSVESVIQVLKGR